MEKTASLTYKLINLITELFPRRGAEMIDRFVLGIAGHPVIGDIFFRRDIALLKGVGNFQKILVIADVHIGDAVITQSAVSALRDFFPEAQIDYVINKAAESVIAGNPEVSNLWPVYANSLYPYPSESEVAFIKNTIEHNDYDLILNLCPFLPAKKLGSPTIVLNHLGIVMSIAQAQKDPEAKSHMVFQLYRYLHSLLEELTGVRKSRDFPGVRIHLSEDARNEAERFLKNSLQDARIPKIFFNLDASTPFTKIPVAIRTSLIKKMAELPCRILLGIPRNEPDSGKRILEGLTAEEKDRVTVISTAFSLDTYAALIDLCDIFITGDTGPMHIAAARKIPKSGGRKFRNKTAVFSIFGATPPRIYGYDSRSPGFPSANQDSYSRTYIPPSSARNLTYIVKKYIAADGESFFKNLDLDEIVSDIRKIVGSPSPKKTKTPVSGKLANRI